MPASQSRRPALSSDTQPLTIRLLGPVDVTLDGAPLRVDTRKAIALLAYLATTDRPASREVLAALLWPESGEVAARGALRRTLSVLHGALGDRALAIDRTKVTLATADVDVDLRRFRAALDLARSHSHPPDTVCPSCATGLAEAARLDRGEFMAGFSLRDSEAFEDWQRAEAETYRRELSAALERLARIRAAERSWDDALDAARRWLALDPLHEPAHRLLMTIHARSGETSAAIRQYRECVRLLNAELGVAPLDETTALYENIRGGRLPSVVDAADQPDVLTGAQPGARQAPSVGGEAATAVPRGVEDRVGAAAPASAAVPPLVGRDEPMAVLTTAYESIDRDGRLLVVDGEPGIGKTRLAAEFADAVRRRRGRVLAARAFEGEGGVPYAPISALIRAGLDRDDAAELLAVVRPDLLSEVGRLVTHPVLNPSSRIVAGDPPIRSTSPVPPAGMAAVPESRLAPSSSANDPFGAARLLEGIADVLTVLAAPIEVETVIEDGQPATSPGLLVIDDADWADTASLDAIAYLVRRLSGRPVAVLLTSRPLDGDGAIAGLLAAAARAGHARGTTLTRLRRDDVATLAASIGGRASDETIDAIFEESEGVPLYVVEALGSGGRLAGQIPGGVPALLRARLSGIGELASQILAAAAVIGRAFDFEVVREASGRSEDEAIAGLDDLVRRGIVREAGLAGGDVTFDFTHGRLRDVTYESLGLVRRRLLHRRVADALRARPGLDERLRWARVAAHDEEAGRSAEAADAHRRAGDAALRVFANHEAREHLEAALALGHPAAAELHRTLADVLTLLGDYGSAIQHLESAAALAAPDAEFEIEHRLALVHARRGDWRRAEIHASAASQADPNISRLPALLADRSIIASSLGQFDQALRFGVEALSIAEEAADADGIARACEVLGLIHRRRGDRDSAMPLLERAVAVSRETGDRALRIAARNALALALADRGDIEGATALTIEALDECERLGDRHRQAALENNLADLLKVAGRRDEAMSHLKRAVSLFADVAAAGTGAFEPEIWMLVEW